jgi:hypothetical protein
MGHLGQWFAGLSLPALAFALIVMMLAVALIGHGLRQLAKRLANGRGEEPNLTQESYLIGSMLGLLALLLAFSLSIAIDRHDERRQLVVQEANAIGTAYLRAQLLDEPHRTRLSKLLIDYTDIRLALAEAEPGQVGVLLAQNDRLLTDIWAGVVAARESALAHGISTPVLSAFNEVIDLDTERKMSRRLRVPSAVLELVLGFLALTAGVLGYVLEERRSRLGAAFLFVLLSLYVSILADFNRPTSGRIKESQEPMELLRASLKAQPSVAFDRFKVARTERPER